MAGGVISKMTFYLKTPAASSWTATWQVYLAEVDGTTLTGIVGPSAGTVVFEGALAATRTEMTITFDTPYTYNGGNLLIGSYVKSAGNYKSASFLGVATDGATAFYKFGSASYQQGSQSFLPKTTFDYFSTGGGTITATPSVLDLGDCPNGYSNEPATFELSTSGLDILTVTSMEVDNDYFQLDVEAPFTVSKNNSVTVNVTTGSGEPGVQNGQVTITYGESETVTVDLTANVYDVVSPDIWQLAEEVTDFPFHTVTETDNLYHNYNIPGGSAEGKDAVYKVTFTEDVLLSAGNNGDNAATMIYPEDFNGEVGPGLDNYYYYDGPQVNPGPLNYWFSYAYTGTNTFFGTSTGGGMYFGYRITPAQLQELGLGNCAIITVEAAARNSDAATFYDLAIMKGGDEPNFDNIVYYQGFSDFTPGYFFDINLNEPQLMGDDENIWIMLYSDSPYAAYCGKTPVDTENGKIWYTTDMSTWYSSTNYTPMIYCQFLEIPTGRTVNMNLANMEIKSNPNATAGQLGEAAGAVNGVSKAQRYMEAKAQYSRGNRDGETYQIENLYVPAGTYYVVVSSTSEDFEVNMMIDEVPNPEQAVVYTPYEGETNVASPYYAEWSLGYYTKEMQVLCGTENPPVTALIDWTDYLVEAAFMTSLDNNRTYYFQVNERNDTGVTEGEIISFTTPFDMVQGFEAVSPYIYVGDVAEFTWNAIEDEELLGYNIYLSGEKLNESIITETSYTYEGLEYNPYGYSFFVEAVYEGGISNRIGATVFVSGYGNVDGHVYEQDGVTPIEGAYVMFQGTSDFGQAYGYGVYTNEEGYYNAQLVAGYYDNIYAAKAGYQTAYQAEEYALAYQEEIESVNFNLDEEFYGVDYVDAAEELPYPRISWGNYLLKADFEEGIPEGWTMIDADGDGYNWSLKSNGGHESDQSVISASWIYGVGAVSPDNFLVTPQIPLGGKLSFWARTNDANYSAEHFGLAVSTGSNDNPEDFTMLQEWTMTAKRGGDSADRNNMNRGTRGYEGEWYEYEVDLSAYEGQNGYVAIRHFNTYDMFELNVDDVIVDNRNYTGDRSFQNYRVYRTAFDNDGPYNVNNTELIAEVADETSIYDVTFGDLEDGLYKYGVSCVYEGNRDGALNWTMIDADYDGRCWMLGSEASLGFGHGHNGSNDMMISKSFENGSSVYPDNYLVSPLVQFGNQSRFEFYACAQDANYPEYVGVAVSTSGNEYAYDFATIAEWQVDNERSQGIWHKYVVELDQYAGQEGYIAIRHFNSSYNFYLDIDDASFYDIDVQLPRESAIRWSNMIGKGMYLTDGAVDITVTLASGDAPEGIVATFKNLTQPEYEDIVVELDENGYYSFDSFRKGEYEVTLTKADYYDEVGTYYIMEPTSIEFMMYEHLYAPRNLKVSHTGYARWDAPQSPDRHLVDDLYNIYLYDANDGSMLWYTTVYDNYMYLPEDMLTDGVMYITQVRAYYSANGGGLYPSELTSCTWTYRSCDHYVGADNLKAKSLDEGVYMTWEYPVVDETRAGDREVWDLLKSFYGTSAGQQAVATDGNYIYTASWQSSPTGGYTFYQYDLEGNFIEGFNIEGATGIRDITYDGKYFYATSGGSNIFELDLNNRILLSTIYCSGLTSRHISYDPVRDGFWAGNWTTLALYNRSGEVMLQPDITLSNVYGSAYYNDNEGEHLYLFCQPDNLAYIYDYNIDENTVSAEPLFDFATVGSTGMAGGAFIGEYDGKTCLFGNVQQDPNFIGIIELESIEPAQVLGANVYVNDEYFGFTEGDEWMFEGYNEYNSFSIRVVYDNYDMSCMQYAEMINRYWIYTAVYSGSGYVTESAMYYEGDTCVLTATPSDNYDFYSWMDGWYGGTVSYEPTYSFVVEREGYYGAQFITDHYWNDVNLYENNMGVIGIVKIEDEEVDGVDAPLVEIGAFCNGECRGHQRLHYYPQVDRYLVYLTVYGNEGDDINFHLSINGIEQSMMCTTTVVFEADAVVGTPFEPYVFNFYSTFWNEQFNEFNAGWNWWSTYIEQGGNYNGLADLQAYLTNSGYMISSQTEFTMNYGTYGWYGSLNSIDNESMYKIKMNEPGYSDLYYYNARTDLHPITVVPGWNYIGYVSYYSMDLEDALIGLEPSNGDMIKSQYAYANYYEGYGWFGSLNYMEPGMGYMYKAADTATFIYGEATRGITKENLTAENNHWMPNTNAYRDNMTVMAVVNLNDVEVNSDNYELAAFADGECRGSVRLTYAEPLNRYVAFLTVAGEETATLSFGLYDAATGAECYSDDNFEFNSDIMVGNPGEPVVISFKGMNDNSGFMVYPNPVAKGERVNIVIPNGSDRVQVEVVNSLGEVVSVETLTQSQASIALPQVPGVYTVRIITDNKDTNFKKVIVK